MTDNYAVSAIVPVGQRYDESGELAGAYLQALEESGAQFELVYVLDDRHGVLADNLLEVAKKESRLRIIQLARSFGEATALSAGTENSAAEIILTLPAYWQVDPPEIGKLFEEIDDCDMAVAVRWPRAVASKFEKFRRDAFHWLVAKVSRLELHDLGCGVRIFRRSVTDEIPIYGDQYRFVPLLAFRRGFSIKEVRLRQSEKDRYEQGYGPKTYLQRLLDIFTVVFLVRFTKKPLRFFGTIGSIMALLGSVFLLYVVFERFFLDISLADRPALLLSSLLVVLGLQIFALGLLGELIIFTHARELKEYTIERVVN